MRATRTAAQRVATTLHILPTFVSRGDFDYAKHILICVEVVVMNC